MNAVANIGYVPEIEQEVLGTLLSGANFALAQNVLETRFFIAEAHRLIYDACATAYQASGSCKITVASRHIDKDALGKLVHPQSGSEYLAALVANVTFGKPRLLESSKKVVEQWARLTLAEHFSVLSEASNDISADVKQVTSRAGEAIDEVSSYLRSGPNRKTRFNVFEAAQNSLQSAQEARERGNDLTGITWGLADVNSHTGGIQRRDLTLMAARPSMGKAQPVNCLVRVPNGWKKIAELRVGDEICSLDGHYNSVTGIFPQGEKEVFCVEFSDGRKTKACAEHLWSISYRNWPEPRIVSTRELQELLSKKTYQKRLWINLGASKQDDPVDLPIDPWIMGALLGDGCLQKDSVRFSSADKGTLERMAGKLKGVSDFKHVASCDYALTNNGDNIVLSALRDLGLDCARSNSKFVPSIYKNASFEQRLEVIRGLLDTDGWVERHGSVCFGSVSLALAKDFQEMVRSVGAWCTLAVRSKSFTYGGEKKIGQPFYVCVVAHPEPSLLFHHEKKLNRLAKIGNRKRRKMPTVVSVTPCGIAECACISVSHSSKLYITDDYVVTHNTTVAMSCAVQAAMRGYGVGFISLEMDAEKVAARIVSDIAYENGKKIPYANIIRGKIDKGQDIPLQLAADRLKDIPLFIEDQSGLTMSAIRFKAESLIEQAAQAECELDCLIVDHIGLIKPSSRYNGNRVNEMAEISAGLKEMARELDVAVLALSQLSRAVEQRNDKRPMLSDLRDSGALEQDADTIIFLYREAYYLERQKGEMDEAERLDKLTQCQNELEFIIAKQRNGPVTTVKLFADMAYSAVRNAA